MIPIVTPDQLHLIPDGVVTADRQEVCAYLKTRPELVRLLEALCPHVQTAFGPESELALEVYKDPEIDDRHLTLYVRLSSYEIDISDRIVAACTPFEEARELLPDYFLVTTDFRRPGVTNPSSIV